MPSTRAGSRTRESARNAIAIEATAAANMTYQAGAKTYQAGAERSLAASGAETARPAR
jgi:hypothetical protein